MRKTSSLVLALAVSIASGSVVVAKVATIPLAELVKDAEFIGVVRVERVSRGIPFVKKRRATAKILQTWKGQSDGTITFVAAATRTCDIADAKGGRRGACVRPGRQPGDDDLTIFDVEQCFLTGRISKRQRDRQTGEWKYLVRGEAVSGDDVVAVARISGVGPLVVVTVYLLGDEDR